MERYVGSWDHRTDVKEDEKHDGMCEECFDARGRNISKYVDVFQEVSQRCTLSPNLLKIYMLMT